MIGIIVLCRYNSSRLPGKILKKIKGKEILKYIHERLDLSTEKNNIVIATSNSDFDKKIVNFCKNNNYNYYVGDLNNVAKRFLDCAVKSNFEIVVRINGDNIFSDYKLIDRMIEIFKSQKLNFLSNVPGRTWPKGISVEIVKTSFFKENIEYFDNEDKEHVMTYFYKKKLQRVKFLKNELQIKNDIDLAIDTFMDFKLAENIIRRMKKKHIYYDYKEIIDFATYK